MGMSGDTALALAKSYVKKTLQGQGALKGQDGFNPTVKENQNNTNDDYRLDITDKNGTFTTPNLKADNNYIAETYATKTQVNGVDNKLTTNLLKPTLATTISNGVTCTNNGDGTYTLNGTSTEFTAFTVATITDLGGKRIVGCPSGSSKSIYIYAINRSNWGNQQYDYGNGVNVSSEFSKDIKWEIRIGIGSGYTCNNLVFKPMITTNLNATYDDFVPYTGSTGQLNSDVAELKNDLGGLSFSVIDGTLSITDGTNTWTLPQTT